MLPGLSPPLDLFCAVVQLSCWIMLQSLWHCSFGSICFCFIAMQIQSMPSLHTLSCSSQDFKAECASFQLLSCSHQLVLVLHRCCIAHVAHMTLWYFGCSRSNPPGANVARSNAAGSTSSEQVRFSACQAGWLWHAVRPCDELAWSFCKVTGCSSLYKALRCFLYRV